MHDEREDCRTLQRSLQLLTVSAPAWRRTLQDRATVVALGAHTIGKGMSDPKLAGRRELSRRIRHSCYPPVAGATSQFVTKEGPRPIVQAEPTASPSAMIPPSRRTTSVPFTRVTAGSQRTTTDNTEAASTCPAPHPRR